MNILNGKKSYLIAIATIVYAVAGVLLGNMSMDEAIKLVLASGALASLRHSVEKVK